MGRRTCDLCGSEDKVWLVGGFARCEACEAVDAVDLLRSWTDPEKLTLDVLRRELGEPVSPRDPQDDEYWVEHGAVIEFDTMADSPYWLVESIPVNTLGQLRRILSVITETTPGGGDAE